mmetsp:Transcript_5019/g.7448  ORF Transcript_5019/g.7448 Transcript_5019/m.7448 type:complete len:465 (-) Transcript_5019:847-2241(-)
MSKALKNNLLKNPTAFAEFTKHPYYSANLIVQPPRQSVLENGFKIVTERRQSETASVGLFIGAGSRFETAKNNGVAHFLEHCYFKGTKNRTEVELEQHFEKNGALLNANTGREYTGYNAHCLKDGVNSSIDILADMINNSEFAPERIDSERLVIRDEYNQVNADVNDVLFENLHATAYTGSSMGMPILGTLENIDSLTREDMVDFREKYYHPENMALIVVGDVEHDSIVEKAQQHFNNYKNFEIPELPETSYVGSEIRLDNQDMDTLHTAIGFEGPATADGDSLVINIIQTLFGGYDKNNGADSYVSSRLCHAIAKNQLAYSVTPFNHAHSDTSLFGVSLVSSGDDTTQDMVWEAVTNMTSLCFRVSEDELENAKNFLKVSYLSVYEGDLRQVLEDAGRQVIFKGRRIPVSEIFKRIDDITVEDVQRVAYTYMYDQDPVVSIIGDTRNCVDWSWYRTLTTQWRE